MAVAFNVRTGLSVGPLPTLVIDASGNATFTQVTVGPTVISSTGVSSPQLTSTVATGTAPLVVTSTTPVANLNIGGNAATATTATTAATSTNVAGGAAGQLHYQDGPGSTKFLPVGTASQVLIGGATPTWTNAPALAGTNFTGIPLAGLSATGTPDATTYLRGDGKWVAPPAGFVNPMTAPGDIIVGGAAGVAQRLGLGTNGQVLKSNGTTVVWGDSSAATSAVNLAGGSLGAVPYQSAPGTTAFLNGNTTTSRSFLSSVGNGTVSAAPSWIGSTGSGQVVLATNPGLSGATLEGTTQVYYGSRIQLMDAPTNPTDAANKAYVDSVAQGFNPKPAARLCTASALPANTYNNGSSGVGATLTGSAGGVLSVDGVPVATGDFILVTQETPASENGLYVVTNPGATGVNYVLTRSTMMDTSGEFVGSYLPIQAGNTLSGSLWLGTGSLPFTVGTTAITFSRINNPTTFTPGTGISIVGNTISLTSNKVTLGSTDLTLGSTVMSLAGLNSISATSATASTYNTGTAGSVTSGAGSSAATTEFVLGTFDKALYTSGDILIQATNTTTGNFQSTKILCLTNGTVTDWTEYGSVQIGGIVATFRVAMSGNNITLYATPAAASSTQYKFHAFLVRT